MKKFFIIKFKFYKKLQEKEFEMKNLNILEEDKLTIAFFLRLNMIDENLLKFIEIYSEFFIDSKIIGKNLKILTLYYNTLERNVNLFFESTPEKNIEEFLVTIFKTKNFIKKNEKLIDNANNIDKIKNIDELKNLHDDLKKNLIQNFNLENLKILYFV